MPPSTTSTEFYLPRGLILLSSAWLVVSWAAAIGFRSPVEASSASYTPGVRVMLVLAAVGLVVAWPLLRLSQSPGPYPIRQTILDLVVLLALLQVVLWPLRLVTPWSAVRSAAMDATLSAWTLLAGAFVASAIGSDRPGPRNLAMVGCLGLCLGGPLVALACMAVPAPGGLGARLARLGPVMETYDLALGGTADPEAATWRWIILVTVATGAAWSGLSAAVLARKRHAPPSATPPGAQEPAPDLDEPTMPGA